MIELKNIDFLVYICINDKSKHKVKEISKFLKIQESKIYASVNRLIQVNEIEKIKTESVNEYYSVRKMEKDKKNKENIERLKKDPELVVELMAKLMDKKIIRKVILKRTIEKESYRAAVNEWCTIKFEEKKQWVRDNLLGKDSNIDVYLNAVMMMKNKNFSDKDMISYVKNSINRK